MLLGPQRVGSYETEEKLSADTMAIVIATGAWIEEGGEGVVNECFVWGCDFIERQVGMLFQIGGECGQRWILAVFVGH